MLRGNDLVIKSITYDIEEQFLSPYAAFSKDAKREKNITPCPLRTDYQRDRDRIIHSKAFRRLKHKTQVFLSPEGDHYRTRLTHTLEVTQIARTIARALRLNEDLTEAIALGHDLGHTPFGHAGERTLDAITGHFEHNEQSLRVVDILEDNGQGLNLTELVRDGILNHTSKGNPKSLEGKIVSWADRIAYINHDIEDAISAKLLKEKDLPAECTKLLGSSKRARINNMINDIVTNSTGKNFVSLSKEFEQGINALRKFMFDTVYRTDRAIAEEIKTDRLIRLLFKHLMKEEGATQQSVTDYIAGMTDAFAVRTFEKIYVPNRFME